MVALRDVRDAATAVELARREVARLEEKAADNPKAPGVLRELLTAYEALEESESLSLSVNRAFYRRRIREFAEALGAEVEW